MCSMDFDKLIVKAIIANNHDDVVFYCKINLSNIYLTNRNIVFIDHITTKQIHWGTWNHNSQKYIEKLFLMLFVYYRSKVPIIWCQFIFFFFHQINQSKLNNFWISSYILLIYRRNRHTDGYLKRRIIIKY